MKRKSKKSVRQKGQAADLPRMPGLEFFKGLPALDDQTIVATVALIKLALANEFKSKLRTKKAADLLMKANLIFGLTSKEDHGNLVLALAYGAELMSYAMENPKTEFARAFKNFTAMMQRNPVNAVLGGKARATCTDAQIVTGFTDYKRRNPNHSYAAAELKVADSLGYSNHRKLGERVERMTKMTPAKWYSTL